MMREPTQALDAWGRVFSMPRDIAEGSDSEKAAWAVGLLTGMAGDSGVEVKDITVENTAKTYEKLEIHQSSPQVYAVLTGSVRVPVAPELDGGKVRFCEVASGQALVVRAGVWHAGAVGVNVPARLVVVLRKGTTETDTKKSSVSPVVRWGSCS